MGGMRATGPRPGNLAPARGSFSSLPRSPFRPRNLRPPSDGPLAGSGTPAPYAAGAYVQMHRLLHRPPRTLLGLKLKPQSIFALENAVDSFRQRVLRAVIGLRHAHAQPVFSHQNSHTHANNTGFLDRNDGWVSLRLATLPAPFSAPPAPGGRQESPESGAPLPCARPCRSATTRTQTPFPSGSDISHPNLVGLAQRQPLDPVGKHRQTVMGIGRAGIFRRLGSNSRSLARNTSTNRSRPQAHPLVQHCGL